MGSQILSLDSVTVPAFNIINGGSHAGNKLAMQEFMILPTGAAKYGLDATAVGDEGGFAPNFQNNGEAIKLCEDAIKYWGYTG